MEEPQLAESSGVDRDTHSPFADFPQVLQLEFVFHGFPAIICTQRPLKVGYIAALATKKAQRSLCFERPRGQLAAPQQKWYLCSLERPFWSCFINTNDSID